MFTVKWLRPAERVPGSFPTVTLWEAERVWTEQNELTKEANVKFAAPDGTECSLDAGLVYVMNAAGKTVDHFILRDGHNL